MALATPTKFERKLKNPVTNQVACKTNSNVMKSSMTLSQQKIITTTSADTGPIQDSLAILSVFGVTVAEETEDVETSILTDKFLDVKKLEKLEKTQDKNPNLPQEKKFEKLKTKKIEASKIFNQTVNNTINELDPCQTNDVRAVRTKPSNVIQITNDFINFSSIPIAKRMNLK